MPPVPFCLMALCGFAGFYLLLAGSLSRTEVIACAVVAVGMAGLATVLHLRQEHRLRLSMPPVRALWRLACSLPLDTANVGLVLLRTLRRRPDGQLTAIAAQPFQPGEDDPEDAARRALVILGSSLAPNGFVVELPRDARALRLHRLASAAPSRDTRWPV